jgi:hypothetical protein
MTSIWRGGYSSQALQGACECEYPINTNLATHPRPQPNTSTTIVFVRHVFWNRFIFSDFVSLNCRYCCRHITLLNRFGFWKESTLTCNPRKAVSQNKPSSEVTTSFDSFRTFVYLSLKSLDLIFRMEQISREKRSDPWNNEISSHREQFCETTK